MDFEKKKKSHFEKKKKSENQKKKALSLDEVLEKIAEMGIDSLTQDEKQTLDDYANGK
jgi:DNA topoisomerase VI subunit B